MKRHNDIRFVLKHEEEKLKIDLCLQMACHIFPCKSFNIQLQVTICHSVRSELKPSTDSYSQHF